MSVYQHMEPIASDDRGEVYRGHFVPIIPFVMGHDYIPRFKHWYARRFARNGREIIRLLTRQDQLHKNAFPVTVVEN